MQIFTNRNLKGRYVLRVKVIDIKGLGECESAFTVHSECIRSVFRTFVDLFKIRVLFGEVIKN